MRNRRIAIAASTFVSFTYPLLFFSLDITSSRIRQVPDNQEVYAHAATDQSIIFDLLEYETSATDDSAIEYNLFLFYIEETFSHIHFKSINRVSIRFHFRDMLGENGDSGHCKINEIKRLQLPNLIK